jgi:hypothetical protein
MPFRFHPWLIWLPLFSTLVGCSRDTPTQTPALAPAESDETKRLREAIIGKWSQSSSKDLADKADSFTFLPSGELQSSVVLRTQISAVPAKAAGAWKIEGMTLSLKFTAVDPPEAELSDATLQIMEISKDKLTYTNKGKEVTLFRVK